MTESSRRRKTLAAAGLACFLAAVLGGLAWILRPASGAAALAAPSAAKRDEASARRDANAQTPAPPRDARAVEPSDADLPAVAPDPRLAARVRARIAEFEALAARRSKGKVAPGEVSVAVHVREAGRRGELVAIDADRPMRPASNLKLVTSSAALVLLGADWRFETILETSAPVEGGAVQGDLVVRAAGDPLYDREEGDGSVDALLAPAITSIERRGIRSIEGAIVLDELDFATPAPGPGWPDPSQRWAEFCALAGGFSANAGCLTATVRPGSAGAAADVRVAPSHHGLDRRGRVETGSSRSRLDIRVGLRGGAALVDGSIPAGVPSWTTRFAVADPVDLFGSVLRGELADHGISVRGGVRRAHAPGTGRWEELARISTPLSAVVDAMNTDSNNACADQLFFALGHARGGAGTRAGGRAAVAKALERLGVNADGLVQVDGSGLSRDNRATARQISALISAVLRQDEGTAKTFVDSLAVASETGTLDDRMSDGKLAGRVHAKTGFIAGTSALSGILDARDGRRLVFSILVDYPSFDGLNRECWKPMEDAICAELAERMSRAVSPVEVAEAAAREAGALLLESYGKIERSAVHSKSAARDLVTSADIASERLVVARLRAAFPDHAIEAEEEVRDPADDRPRWFVDPLDGTVNFVHGIPAFAVSIALYVGGLPEAAVVHLPRLGETFTAERGRGTRKDGEPVRVSDTAALGEAILATGFPYRRNELPNNNLENFNRFFLDVRGMRRMGSAAMDLAYVAAGRLDGFWELHLAPHDVAAGALLVREAGGIVRDADGGENWLRGGHIVAANPGLFEAIRARIRR